MGGDWNFGSFDINVPLEVHDYYTVQEYEGDETIGVLARKDFGNRAEVIATAHGLMLLIKLGADQSYACKPIPQAEYETYIEFGIPDIGIETSWKKWTQDKLQRAKTSIWGS